MDTTSPAQDRSLRGQARQLLRLSAPIAAAQAGFALMGLIDTAVVGRLGAGPLGAIGLANGVFFVVSVMGIGVMFGLDPLIAQAVGAGDRRRARQLLWQGGWLAAATTAVLTVPLLCMPLFLRRAGLNPATLQDTIDSLWMRLPSLLPTLVFVGARSYLQAAGKVSALVVATVIANVSNLLLDLLLVFGGAGLPAWTGPLRSVPAMGAAGSALATSFCIVLQLGVLLYAVRGLATEIGERVSRVPVLADLRAAAKIGVPVGLQMTAEVGVFALVGVLAGRLGDDALAAHQVALALSSFTFCVAIGIGSAGSVLVGWAVGARDTLAARRAGLLAFGVVGAFMTLCALAFYFLPGPLTRLLSDQHSVIAATAPLMVVAAVFQISDGVQGVGAGVLRGAGETRFAFVANVLGHWAIGLPLALYLGFSLQLGVVGLWWGLCAGLTAVAAALFGRFWLRSRREIAPLEPHPGARLLPQSDETA